MIDFQYFPNVDDPVARLRSAMDNMDGMCGFIVTLYLEVYAFCISASSLLVYHPIKGK